MLSFGKKRKSVIDAELYCKTMFSGLGELHGQRLPNQVFGDPYVFGFLQQLIMHATTVVHRGSAPTPEKMAAVAVDTFERIVPGYGRQIVEATAGIASSTHPLNANYQVGRQEGGEYIIALLNEDQATKNDLILRFREFVIQNYLVSKS